MKNLSKTLLALLCLAIPLTAAPVHHPVRHSLGERVSSKSEGGDKRTVVTLHGATVADVICSERDGHIGFNMPLAPHFTKRGTFESFPKGMTEYPALFKTETGTITTAAMIRFIEQGHTLFSDKTEQATYKKLLKECIDAHKAWHANKTETNLGKLHAAEETIFAKLATLHLNDVKVRTQVEKILSTPSRNFLVKGYRSLVLPNRAWIVSQKNNQTPAPMIKKAHPAVNIGKQTATSLLTALGIFVTLFTIQQVAKMKLFSNNIKPNENNPRGAWIEPTPLLWVVRAYIFAPLGLGILTAVHGAVASCTDLKLAPEPGNGIKVVIKHKNPEQPTEKEAAQ